MTQRIGGTKRSSWLTFRRRLLLVRLLLRGPAPKEQLIAAVNTEMGDQGYPGDAASALKHDLDALKAEYGCRIGFRRGAREYVLDDLGELALLDLPDDCLEALNFLDASFPEGSGLPEHTHIRALLDRVLLLLPPYRQRQYRARRSVASLRLGPSRALDQGVLQRVRQAVERRQELQFDYRDAGEDLPVTRHRVAPYELIFRPEGHAYLDATMLDVSPRRPGTSVPAAVHYRIDRIVPGTVRVLPGVLPPGRMEVPSYRLRYRLAPAVARRRDLAIHFPSAEVEYCDDGSAQVTATVTNLWQTRQALLRYGDACEVLEPPELIELFRASAQGLARIYLGEERATERGG